MQDCLARSYLFVLTVFTAKPHSATTLCCDGEYLYLLTDNGLEKLGSGLGGTANGRVYSVNRKFKPPYKGTLVFAQVIDNLLSVF